MRLRAKFALAAAFCCLVVIGLGCNRSTVWEYKVVQVGGLPLDRTGLEAGKFNTCIPNEGELNKLGQEGWELVSSYLEMETAWMNFGNDNYVTGLQPNVRPQGAVLVFKRPVRGKAPAKDEKKA